VNPLAVRDFRLLSAGQLASTIGDFCYAIALPWYVLSSHGSAVLLGVVLAFYGVPRTALIPVGGVLSDRLSPRTVMLLADASRCVMVAVLVLLATRHTVSLVFLAPTAALIGAGEGLFIPASFAILPSMLDPSQLTSGNGLFMAFQQTGSLIGPAIGGAVVALASPAPAFGIDAASFAVSALTLAFIRRPAAVSAPEPEPASEPAARSGGVLSLLRNSRVLQILLIITVAANLALAGLTEVALPALSHQRFGASGFGVLLTCDAAGGIAGALAATRFGGLRRPAVVAAGAFMLAAIAMCFVPFAGGVPGAAVCMVALGGGVSFGNTIMLPRLQAWAPPELLGRVMSLVMLAAFGSAPLSFALTGLFVAHVSSAAFFPVVGIADAIVFLGGLAFPQWRNFGAPVHDNEVPPLAVESEAGSVN
jgi:predicted MFS family arabinose efflux permease